MRLEASLIMTRFFAVLILMIGVGFIAFGVSNVVSASDDGRFMATAGAAFDMDIDAVDWASHWRVTWVEILVVGCLVGLAGLGLWQGRPGALLLFVAAVLGHLVLDLAQYFGGYARYAFETPDPVGISLYLGAAIGGAVGFLRMRKRHANLLHQ